MLPGGLEAAKERSVTGAAQEFRMRPVKDGLLSSLALVAGFQQIPGSDSAAADDNANKALAAANTARLVRFGIALWSNIPADLPASSILVSTHSRPFSCCLQLSVTPMRVLDSTKQKKIKNR